MKPFVRTAFLVFAVLLFQLSIAMPGLAQGAGIAQPASASQLDIVPARTAAEAAAPLQGRRFEEPLLPVKDVSAAETAELSAALDTFTSRRQIDDLSALEAFVSAHPQSGWNVALLTNLGLLDYHYGLFSKAFSDWTAAWEAGKNIKAGRGKALADRAFGELIRMYARLGHADQIDILLKELDSRPVAGSATEYVDGAKQGLWSMRNNPGVAYLCGPMALKNLLLSLGATPDKVLFLDQYRSGPHGVTLDEVSRLADKAGLAHHIVFREAGDPVPVPSIVHWKVNHYAAIVGRSGNQFHIEDPTFGNDLWVTQQALDAEGSGYYLAPEKPSVTVAQGRAVGLQEASRVFGMGYTGSNDQKNTTPDDKNANSCDSAPGAASATTQGINGGHGLCIYNIKEMVVSLNLVDTPVGYAPPKGPSAFVSLSYNQRDASQPAVLDFFNISPKWTLNWLGYVQDYPHQIGRYVTRYVRGGGEADYSNYNGATGAFNPDPDDASQLVLVSTSPVRYENRFPDGSVEVYAQSDGQPDIRKVFLSQVIDAYGNVLMLNYDAQLRLISLTDATGRNTSFAYELPAFPLLITKIIDPFGRGSELAYDSTGRLKQITDVLGLTSQFHYNVSSLIDTLTTPYGTTSFAFGDNGNERFLNATDPLGHTERVEYVQGVSTIPFSDPAKLIPKGIIAPFNEYLNYRDTYYWDGHAYATAAGDYTKARNRHWTHLASNTNLTANSIESIKYPFENRIWMRYPGQDTCCGGNAFSGSYNYPSLIGRVLDDGSTQLTQNTYNTQGHLIDAVDPNGRETKYIYAANGIDLLQVQQKTSGTGFSQIAAFTYNGSHLPLTATDASGQVSQFTYNSAGQLTGSTNALGQATQDNYDSLGHLTSVIDANGKTKASFTYDAFDRVATSTDSEGYVVNYAYDNFNRVTQETYPDGTTRQLVWNKLDLASVTDRQGKTTQYTYDGARNLVDIADPLGRHTKLAYYENHTLKSLTEPNGNVTSWSIDVQNRVTGKQYADGSAISNAYEATTSRLHAVTDALKQVKQYSYNLDNTLAAIAYANAVNPTPNVSFSYDPYYQRIAAMTDGTGTTSYSYGGLGAPGALRLAQESSAFQNQPIVYGYDALGRLSQRTIGAATETLGYDVLGRISSDTNQLGVFDMTYLGETSQLKSRLLRELPLIGNLFEYDSNTNDRRLKAILNTYGTRSFAYDTTPEGLISKVTESKAGLIPVPLQSWSYSYDSAYRLTGAASSQGQQYAYGYDSDDNILQAAGPTYNLSGSYNALDQLTSGGGFSFAYDKNGNLLSDGIHAYSWDAENRLISVTSATNGTSHTTTFLYDGRGRRVAIDGQQADNRYIWCGDTLCASEAGDGSIARYYYAEGEESPASHEQLYYAQDNLGSIRGAVGLQGSNPVIASYDYDPYGNPMQADGAAATDFRFAGMFYDQQDGLYLTKYRAYNPTLGRWLSRDPIGFGGGINNYAYAGDSPGRFVDPLGLVSPGAPGSPENPIVVYLHPHPVGPSSGGNLSGNSAYGGSYSQFGPRGIYGQAAALGGDLFEMGEGSAQIAAAFTLAPLASTGIGAIIPLALVASGSIELSNGLNHLDNDIYCLPHDVGTLPSLPEVVSNLLSNMTGIPELADTGDDIQSIYDLDTGDIFENINTILNDSIPTLTAPNP